MATAYELDICLPGTFAADDDDDFYDTAEEQDSNEEQDDDDEKGENNDKSNASKVPQESDGVPAALHEIYVPSAQQKQDAKVQYHGDAAVEYGSVDSIS
jgi:hypothetical protein